jgi:hypothetical protein
MPGQVPGQFPGAPANSQMGGGYPYPTAPGSQGASPQYGQPGTQPLSNDATKMIQSILTSPRPMGAPTSSGGAIGGMGGQMIGGGIAGVASTLEQDSIKVYEEHQKYNEWEFIYDPAKDRTGAGVNAAGGVPGTPANQMGSQQQGGFGQQQGGFGQQQGGFGSGSFGQQQGGFGSQPQPVQPGRRDD